MNKKIYKVVDEKGRVLIPKELRVQSEIEPGDIVRLFLYKGNIMVKKVDLVEAGSQEPESVEAFVQAAVKTMCKSKQIELARKLLQLAEREDVANPC